MLLLGVGWAEDGKGGQGRVGQCKIKSPEFSSSAEVAMSVTYFFVRNFATLVCLCVLCISTSFLCVNTNKAPPKPQNNLKTKKYLKII